MTATRTGLGRRTDSTLALVNGTPSQEGTRSSTRGPGDSISGARQDEEGSEVTRPGDEVSGTQRRRDMALTSSLLTAPHVNQSPC